MFVCDHGYGIVVYQAGTKCPLCEFEDQIKELEAEVALLESRVKTLEEQVHDRDEQIEQLELSLD